ncbi:YwdI family protein [Virgibacillus xinjiangensis]|uniref:YwdI family protein n=1 Tax=Virgibacillus xinjiangensis TaxID=393090 RepID=A0ABV7CQD9_9BACI
MAIANETIIQKMMKELQEAKAEQHKQEKLTMHMEKIRMLCDLFLEGKATPERKRTVTVYDDEEVFDEFKDDEFTEEEIKAMIGDTDANRNSGKTRKTVVDDDDDANGDSIFDF